jgi:DNA-binding NarL/FixJ family response regulator
LIGYCHAFRPDVAIVETGLPGKPLSDVLTEVESSMTPGRILVIGGDNATDLVREGSTTEILRDVEHLMEALVDATPEEGA